jgi:nitronate monooxygenase
MSIAGRLGLRHPLIQAPMAGVSGVRLAAAVCLKGGLGSLPCAFLDSEQTRAQVRELRAQTEAPFNLNFFCHTPPAADEPAQQRWREALAPLYAEWDIEDPSSPAGPARRSFGEEQAALVTELKPAVVSFHFGLPESRWLESVKASGALVISSATTVDEARWLQDKGVDAVIVQGIEAGGHRGMFLRDTLDDQPPTLELLAQAAAALTVPLIAAGGIGDRESVRLALDAGAAAVQVGTAFMLCPECDTSDLHRQALREAPTRGTVITNLYSGRPARSIRTALTEQLAPLNPLAPPFPTAGQALAPLRAAAEAAGHYDFTPVWSGTRPEHCSELPVADVIDALFS